MSKNLTFKDTVNGIEGVFVNALRCLDPEFDYHIITERENYFDNPNLQVTHSRTVIKGPAIDRLYEFEKLGMEPEEIQKLKLENADLIRKRYDDRQVKEDYDALVKSTNDLNERYKSLEARNIALENRNKKLEEARYRDDSIIQRHEDKISELMVVIESLKQRNAEFVKENRSLKEKRRELKINLDAAYKGLEHKNKTIDSLREDISDKAKKIQNFEISMEQLVDHIRTLESKDWCKVAKEQEGKINELECANFKLRALALKIKDLETENKDLKAKMETINNLSDLDQPVWKKDIPCLVDISLMGKKGE